MSQASRTSGSSDSPGVRNSFAQTPHMMYLLVHRFADLDRPRVGVLPDARPAALGVVVAALVLPSPVAGCPRWAP